MQQNISAQQDTASFTKLTDTAVYYRCHMQLVRERPNENDKNLISLRNKKITGSQACNNLLLEASLQNDGNLVEKKPRALNILRTLQSLHSSWFHQKEFIRDEVDNTTYNIFDSNEMGYHFTYNLLSKSERVESVLTRKNSFRSRRFSLQKPLFLAEPAGSDIYQDINKADWIIGDVDLKDVLHIKPKQVEFGQLIGLEFMKKNENTYPYKVKLDESLNFDLTNNLGAGVIGTRSYILLNTLQKSGSPSDGGMLSHRSWSKAIFQDLLCRHLPVVRQEDVGEQVYPNSKLAFRKDKSCMRCHVSIDPMANSIRNVYEVRSSPKYGGDTATPRILAEVQQSHTKTYELQDADPHFHKRPTTGQLFYRTYNGELVNREVSNVQELGEALAEKDDFYICTAKKYFNFFTGINVSLDDFPNENYQTNDLELMSYRQFVINLGLDLKKSQNLKKMIAQIFESTIYQDLNYKVVHE